MSIAIEPGSAGRRRSRPGRPRTDWKRAAKLLVGGWRG
jgi:hypothetical protein